MNSHLIAAAAALAVLATPAAAQFGDTGLAYRDGVVYDDNLVPGEGVNAPFQAPAARTGDGTSDGFVREGTGSLRLDDPLTSRTFDRIEGQALQGVARQ